MFIARSIAADHNDLVHDVAYDFYGKRLATCSSDQTVKVWDRGEDGEWHCSASWKTHSGSVWKVTWAHPEFGQVLATCSYDRMATVWEELVAGKGLNGGERGQSHWIKRTSLVDSRTSVTDVKFAPKQLGLQLATCSADGMVRVYEAPDVMNLSQWSLQSDINCRMPLSCISWNHSFNRNQPPMLAVGSDDPGPSSLGKVHVYEYCEGSRRWTRVESVVTVVEPVHDLAFAPSLGRSFFLLGIASRDVRIVSLKPLQPESTLSQLQEGTAAKFETKLVGQFEDHNSQVWRVSWNILGTILASSGDDGCVRLWKGVVVYLLRRNKRSIESRDNVLTEQITVPPLANYMGIWKCIAALQGDGCVIQGDKHAADSSSFAGNTSGPSSGYHPLIQGGHHTRVLWH